MSAIQELAPYIAEFQPSIKRAKAAKGYTNNDLIALSGVSKSAVDRLCDGSQTDPKLYYAVAICKSLDLSIDDLFGLSASSECAPEIAEKLHGLELQNHEKEARLSEIKGALNVAICDTEHQKETAEMLRSQNKGLRYSFFLLFVLFAFLVFTLLFYIIWDSSVPNDGLIRNGNVSILAYIAIGLVAASFLSICGFLFRLLRKK